MKPTLRLCKAIEKQLAYDHKFSSYIPSEFDFENADNKKCEYFKKYGFSVPNYVKDMYFSYNGIVSEKYISSELYLFYIFPYLVNRQMMFAYIDKNNYEMLFPDIRQPKVILRNQNGYLSLGKNGDYKMLSMCEAVDVLSNQDSFIIKPSNDSGGGKGVRKIRIVDGKTNHGETMEQLLDEYKQDYVVQEIVEQYEPFNRLNENSLNTMRIITYRKQNNEFVSLGAFIRFGVNNAEVDSGAKGGLICKVNPDGLIDDRIFHIRSVKRSSLKEMLEVENLCVPDFNEVLEFCFGMHSRLNYFDMCGWDIAIGKDGKPVFVELNQYPDCESFQMVNGPMFGDYTDDLMSKMSSCKTQITMNIRREFDAFRQADFWLADI